MTAISPPNGRFPHREAATLPLDPDPQIAQIAFASRSVGRLRLIWTQLLLNRAEGTHRALQKHLIGVQHTLEDNDLRQLQEQSLREDASRFERGAIGAWVSPILAGLMGLAFVASDATYVFTTTRVTLDVPESLPWYIPSPANILALAMALILTTTCFTAAAVGARTIAHMLDPSGGDLQPSSLGPRGQLTSFIPRIAYLMISLSILIGVSVVLHQLAVARFSSQLFATDTGTAQILTVLITTMPSLLLASTVLACNPKFVHHRRLAGHRAKIQRMRYRSVNAEEEYRRSYLRQYQRAERSLGHLQDQLDIEALRHWPTGLPPSIQGGRLNGIPQPLGRTPLAGHLPAIAASRFARLPDPDLEPRLPNVWRLFLDAPLEQQPMLAPASPHTLVIGD